MTALVAALLVVVLVAFVNCQDEGRIVGGTNAAPGQVPHQVSLRTPGGSHYCGGSIINDRWILTAAHCLKAIAPEYVTVGSIYLNSSFVRYDVAFSISHFLHNPTTKQNDLGLIKTKTKIQFTTLVQPIALASESIADGTQMLASGWGLTQYPGTTPPNTLQVLNTNVYNLNNCTKIWDALPYGVKIYDGNLCVLKALGQAICKGDSGGPVIYNNKQYGVVSFGEPCAKNIPDGLARVSTNLWWINLIQFIFFFI